MDPSDDIRTSGCHVSCVFVDLRMRQVDVMSGKTWQQNISECTVVIFVCESCEACESVIRKLEGHLELIENILAHAGGDDVP